MCDKLVQIPHILLKKVSRLKWNLCDTAHYLHVTAAAVNLMKNKIQFNCTLLYGVDYSAQRLFIRVNLMDV